MDAVIEILNTPIAQTVRTLGYISAGVTLWTVILMMNHTFWRFRFVFLSLATHLTIVSVWAAVRIVDINLSGELFNSILSFTTAGMLLGSLYGAAVRR